MADEQPPSSSPISTPRSVRGRPFKPREGVQRKSKAEREEYARLEAEKAKARAAKEIPTSTPRSSRGGRGASRGAKAGDVTPREDRSRAVDTPSGIFGGSGNSKADRGKKVVVTGVSDEPEGGQEQSDSQKPTTVANVEEKGPTTSSRTTGRPTTNRTDEQVIEVESDEDKDEQTKRDIEQIWISSEEDDEDAIIDRKGKQKASSHMPKTGTGLRPVRAPRSLLGEDDLVSTRKTHKTIRTPKPGDDSAVIEVDADEGHIDSRPTGVRKDTHSSPELSKKPLRRSSNKAKDPKIATETNEERAERLRMNEDIRKMKEEFQTSRREEPAGTFGDDSSKMGKLFLFQFPPLVPSLYDPNAVSSTALQAADGDVDTPEVQIKAEPGTGTTTDPSKGKSSGAAAPNAGMFTASSPASAHLPPGLVGKLKIRKSGKVTLDWGGTDMEVRYGTDVDFLQDAVLVQTPMDAPEVDEDGKLKEQPGTAYALGQVQRKMVVIPDWSKLYA